MTDRHAMTHREIAERIVGSVVQAGAPAVSPDGRLVAFTVGRVDMEANKYRSQVWLTSADGSMTAHPVTSGTRDGNPTWSPDSGSLAFTSARSDPSDSKRKNDVTLHVLPIANPGEVRTIAQMPDGVGNARFSPDGRWIAFESRTQDERYDAEDESFQSPRKIERFFTRLNGEGWVFDRPMHIYVAPVDGTAAPRNLTPGEFQHGGISWLADSSAIITSSQRHDTWDLDFAQDLFSVSLEAVDEQERVQALTSRTGIYSMAAVSPFGDDVAFLGADDSSTYPQNVHVAVIPAKGGEHRFVSRDLDRTFETTAGTVAPIWETATTLLATAEDRGETHIFRVHTDGSAPTKLTEGPITVKSIDFAGGTLAAIIGKVDEVSDLYVLRDDRLVRLTDFASRYAAKVSPQKWERFAVPSADGTVEIDAWIMRPTQFDPAATYPVLLDVHGGPHTQYGETMFDEAQMQAAAGFVVLMSNPRGGSGREQSWGQAILGPKHPAAPGTGWGSVDVDDVMSVLDTALERYTFCDRDRVGMIGGSYGGFMATWLAGRHGDRFKGICSERAVNNTLSEEWSSDIGSIFRVEHGPSYIDDPEAYSSISPIQFIRDITVPMLIIHSENDLRCPISQAEELFMGLRLLRRDVTFYRFPGETHELSRSGSPLHRVQRAEIILDWFAEKLSMAVDSGAA
jgi:dipeptidyl aminopeptidase/acylaminoacyl peptidase